MTTADQIAPMGMPCCGDGHPSRRHAARPRSRCRTGYALGNLVGPLFLQGTPVVLGTFVPAHVLEDAVRPGARVFPGVPFMFDRLVGHCVRDGVAWPPRLETMISAGARLEPASGTRPSDRAAGLQINSLYGTSETAGIA